MKNTFVIALFSTSVLVADFTITGAETTTQNLAGSGAVGIITDTGSINVNGVNGVLMNSGLGSITGQQLSNAGAITISTDFSCILNYSGGSGATITNSGTILATDNEGWGISNDTSNSCTITNSGTITTQGSSGWAVVNDTSNSCTITNSGTITVSGISGYAIFNDSSTLVTIANSGTIRMTANNGVGVYNNGSNSCTLTNSGTITTSGSGGHGVLIENSNSCTTTNSGTISTTGDNAYGIYSSGSGNLAEIINSGTITTTGGTGYGILDEGASSSITNSGTIKSAQSYAINFTGTNPTLILNQGSNIQGPINTVSALNLTVQNGLNLRLTIEEQNGFGAINISMPYVKIGNTETIATVDPKSFAMQSDILEDLSDSILDDIYRNADNYINCSFPGQGVWVAGIGTTRRRGGTIETNNWQGGVLVGYDGRIGKESALGGFVGGSWGKGTVGGDIATAPMQSYFGGLTFEQQYKWAFFSAALSAGYFQSSNTRTVFYNLAPNGQQTAKGNSGGGMLTAEVQAEAWLLQPYTFRPLITATLRYAGLYLGSYTESGSSSNLSVSSRNISLIKPKLLLNVAISNRYKRCNSEEKRPYDYEFVKVEYTMQPYVGVAGRFQVGGNTVNSQLLGASLNFSSTAPKNIAELLFGISGNLIIEGSWSVFFNAEGLFDTQRSSRFLGEGGFNYSF